VLIGRLHRVAGPGASGSAGGRLVAMLIDFPDGEPIDRIHAPPVCSAVQ
jgi:hypothetical protein